MDKFELFRKKVYNERYKKSLPIESTLKYGGNFISSKRRDGNSTRLADHAISIIMSGKICIVEDHSVKKQKECNKILFNRVLNRLKNEFPQWSKSIISNRNTFEIYIQPNENN